MVRHEWTARWAMMGVCAGLIAARPAVAQTARAEWLGLPERLFVNQVVEATLRIEVTGADIGQNLQLTPGPEAESGLVTLGGFRELEPHRAVVGGEVRSERRFRVPLTALAAGSVRIAPTLTLGIVSRRSGIWNAFMEERRQVAVAPVTLRIEPVPEEGRPADWAGLVGNFTLEVDVAPRELAIGDLCHIRAVVTGVGRMELAEGPRVEVSAGFRTYAVRLVGEDDWRRTFEQIVVPLNSHATKIGPVSFSFFEPAAGAYRTLSAGPYDLRFREKTAVTLDVFRPEEAAAGATRAGRSVAERAAAWRHIMQGGLAVGLALLLTAAGANAIRKRWRRGVLWLGCACIAGVAVLLIGRAGWGESHARVGKSEAGRAAPSRAAMALLELPAGSHVRIVERAGEWVRVRYEGAAVWIRADALER